MTRSAANRACRKKTVNKEEAGLGDCINCAMCVQVCPVGIDIRNGLQYQCIGCAACIDACDEIMDKMGYPSGLIRYTTESALEHEYAEKDIKNGCSDRAWQVTARCWQWLSPPSWSVCPRAKWSKSIF